MCSMAEYDEYSDDYYTDEDCDSYMEQEYCTIGPNNTEPYDLPMTPRLEAYIRDLKARFGHSSVSTNDSDNDANINTFTPEDCHGSNSVPTITTMPT